MGNARSSFDGTGITFEVSGSGEPALVFIHGLTGDRGNFDSQMSFFADAHTVVAIDLPGSGGSGRNRSAWSFPAFGSDVADVVKLLGLDDVVLVGHSFGGDVTVEAALILGDAVRALVWVSSYRSFGDAKTDEDIAAWLAPFDTDFEAAMEDLTRRNFGPDADPAMVDAAVDRARATDSERVSAILNAKFRNEPTLVAGLAEVAVPVFAINPGYKASDVSSLNAHGVELSTVGGVGHFTMMEAPDRFNDVLQDILRRVDA